MAKNNVLIPSSLSTTVSAHLLQKEERAMWDALEYGIFKHLCKLLNIKYNSKDQVLKHNKAIALELQKTFDAFYVYKKNLTLEKINKVLYETNKDYNKKKRAK